MPKTQGNTTWNVDFARERTYFSEFLTVGATKDFIGDYSGSSIQPAYVNNTGQTVFISALTTKYLDGGGFDVTNFANGPPLTNGIRVCYEGPDGTSIDITDNAPITNNVEWDLFISGGSDFQYRSFGSGPNAITATYRPVMNDQVQGIKIAPGRRFFVTLNDDFTNLVGHFFKVSGFYYSFCVG